MQLAAVAVYVLFLQEPFNRCGARGWRAEAACRHGIAQLLFLDQLSGTLHGCQQRSFREACRRLGLVRLDLDVIGPDALLLLHGRQLWCFVFSLRFLAINREPACGHQHLAFRLEGFSLDASDPCRDVVLGSRKENGEKTLGDEVVQFLLGFREVCWCRAGWNDGEVVGNLGVVEDALVRMGPAALENLTSKARIGRAGKALQSRLDRRDVIFGQIA